MPTDKVLQVMVTLLSGDCWMKCSAKLPDLLAKLNIPDTSKLAAMMAVTLAQCEATSPEAHVQPATASPTCVTSLEEMINYVADGFPQDDRIYPLNRTILPGTYNINTNPYSFFVNKNSTIARNCNKYRNKVACFRASINLNLKPPLKLPSVCLLCLTDITPLNGPAAAEGPNGGGSFKVLETKAFDRSIVCYKSMFPYAVFKCDHVSAEGTIKTYAVAMESQADGSHMHQVASCRINKDSESDVMTRKFGPDSNYDNAGACHWITDAFVWVPVTTAWWSRHPYIMEDDVLHLYIKFRLFGCDLISLHQGLDYGALTL